MHLRHNTARLLKREEQAPELGAVTHNAGAVHKCNNNAGAVHKRINNAGAGHCFREVDVHVGGSGAPSCICMHQE